MNTDNLNRWLSLGANLGVIVGLLVVAYEIRQNSDFLIAQGRAVREEGKRSAYMIGIQSPELRTAIVKTENGEATTREEDLLIYSFFMNSFNQYQASWLEYRDGRIELEDLGPAGWRQDFREFPRMREQWESVKFRFRRDFVAWYDENIVVE
jgi:hypothetical protein